MIRGATRDDAEAISEVFAHAREGMAYLPRIPGDVRPLLGDRFLSRAELWVTEEDGRIVGFAGVSGSELTHLYFDPPAQDSGLGSALLEHVKGVRPEGLELWVFQKNEGARRFYERHGFELLQLTDGARIWRRSRTRFTSGVRPTRADANASPPSLITCLHQSA